MYWQETDAIKVQRLSQGYRPSPYRKPNHHETTQLLQFLSYLGRNAHELLGVHVTLALLGLLDIGEGGRNDDGLAIVGEALEGRERSVHQGNEDAFVRNQAARRSLRRRVALGIFLNPRSS